MIKAKLYKGPFHGKTYMIQDGMPDIVLAKQLPGWQASVVNDSTISYGPSFTTITYRRTHHTHPDGSRFYVFVQ